MKMDQRSRSDVARAALACFALIALAMFGTSTVLVAGENGHTRSAVSPVFSPDGLNLAFLLKTPARTGVAVVPCSGGDYRTLASFEGEAHLAGWFPDGKAVVVASTGSGCGVWRVPIDGSPKMRLASGKSPRISPDGKALAFFSDTRLHVADLASHGTIHAGAKSAEGWRMGDWLDPKRLAVLTGDGNLMLVRGEAPAGATVLVPHQKMVNSFVAAAANAKRRLIALTSDDMQHADPDNPFSLWIYTWDGKQVGKPIPNAARPAWTESGRLFFSRRGRVHVTDNFRTVRPLVKAETWAVSPDGSLMAISRRDVDTNGDGLVNWLDAARLYRVTIRGQKVKVERKPLAGPAVKSVGPELLLQPQSPVLDVRFASEPSHVGAEIGTRTAFCRGAAHPPALDGVLDDPCWATADPITGYMVSTQADTPAKHQTLLRMLYDDKYLYVAFRCEHPNAGPIQCQFGPKNRDGLVFRDESVEMFFDAEHSHQRYHQIIVTAGCALFDDRGVQTISEFVDPASPMLRLKEKRTRRIDASWNSMAEFTPSREENAWIVEGRIPLADFGVDAVSEGAVWGFNTCRDQKTPRAQNVWAPIVRSNFHSPRYFGNLVFGRRILTLSDADWGVGHGQCRMTLKVKPEGNAAKRVALRLALVSAGERKALASVEKSVPPGQATPVELTYALPDGCEAGKLILSVSADGKPACSRAHHFTLPSPLEVSVRKKIISTAARSLDVVLWMHYGAASMADASLTVEVRNISAGKRYRARIPDIGGILAAVSLSPTVIGEGNGVIRVALIRADGKTLADGSTGFEIIEDPFAE